MTPDYWGANVMKYIIWDITSRLMDQWLANKTLHEKTLMEHKDITLAHRHARFGTFEVMDNCTFDCIGGECCRDKSKIACGVTVIEAPCVVYSIEGNNNWAFEKDLLQKTPCEIYMFDCTRLRENDLINRAMIDCTFITFCLCTSSQDSSHQFKRYWERVVDFGKDAKNIEPQSDRFVQDGH